MPALVQQGIGPVAARADHDPAALAQVQTEQAPVGAAGMVAEHGEAALLERLHQPGQGPGRRPARQRHDQHQRQSQQANPQPWHGTGGATGGVELAASSQG